MVGLQRREFAQNLKFFFKKLFLYFIFLDILKIKIIMLIYFLKKYFKSNY